MFDALIVSLSLLLPAPIADDPPAVPDPPAAEAAEAAEVAEVALPMRWLTPAEHVPGELATRTGLGAVAAANDVVVITSPVMAADGTKERVVTAHDIATGAHLATMTGAPPLDESVSLMMNGMQLATNGVICAVAEQFVGGSTIFGGRVHLHDVATGAWRSTLVSSAPERDVGFGMGVAMDDDVLVVRSMMRMPAPGETTSILNTEIFDLATGERRFVVPDPVPFRQSNGVGAHVALHDGIAAIGVPGAASERDAPGAVLLIDVTTGTVTETILPPASATEHGFGTAVALNERFVVIGAVPTSARRQPYAYCFDRVERALRMIPAPEPDVPFGTWIEMLDDHHALISATGATRGGKVFAGNAWAIDLRTGVVVGEPLGASVESWSQQRLGVKHAVTATNVIMAVCVNVNAMPVQGRDVPYVQPLLVIERAALLPSPE